MMEKRLFLGGYFFSSECSRRETLEDTISMPSKGARSRYPDSIHEPVGENNDVDLGSMLCRRLTLEPIPPLFLPPISAGLA